MPVNERTRRFSGASVRSVASTPRQQGERTDVAASRRRLGHLRPRRRRTLDNDRILDGEEEDTEEILEEEQGGEDEEKEIMGAFCSVFELSCDTGGTVVA